MKEITPSRTDERFYVFYDANDRVVCCGTAKQLVESGYYSSVSVVHTMACRIKNGEKQGCVVILKGAYDDEDVRSKKHERKKSYPRTAKVNKRERSLST
jgi:hypothetical protein